MEMESMAAQTQEWEVSFHYLSPSINQIYEKDDDYSRNTGQRFEDSAQKSQRLQFENPLNPLQ